MRPGTQRCPYRGRQPRGLGADERHVAFHAKRKWIVIYAVSDSERRGQMVGAYYLVRDLIVSTGAILGAYLWKVGPGLNFLGAAALGATGTIFYVKTIRQSRQAALNDLKKQLEMRRTRWK